MAQLTPERERALDRQAFLRKLFTVRDMIFDFGDTNTPVRETGDTYLEVGRKIPVHQVAELLGVDEAEVAALIPVTLGEVFFNEDIGGWDETFATTDRVDVVYWLLKRQSRERIRKLLRDLGAVVEISRPRPKAERELHGPTPVEERITLCIGALRTRWPVTPRSANETNVDPLFTPTT